MATYDDAGMLRVARVARGVTMAELARKLTPPRSTMYISRLERGESARITPGIAESIARILNVNLDSIFETKE